MKTRLDGSRASSSLSLLISSDIHLLLQQAAQTARGIARCADARRVGAAGAQPKRALPGRERLEVVAAPCGRVAVGRVQIAVEWIRLEPTRNRVGRLRLPAKPREDAREQEVAGRERWRLGGDALRDRQGHLRLARFERAERGLE